MSQPIKVVVFVVMVAVVVRGVPNLNNLVKFKFVRNSSFSYKPNRKYEYSDSVTYKPNRILKYSGYTYKKPNT